jgi:hypothetical protein
VSNSNFNPVSGYLNQDWNPVQLEINGRVQRMMAGDRRLDWAAAFQAVMAADPSLAGKNWDAINVEISRRVKAQMAANNALDYGRALQAVLLGDPNLARDYRAAKFTQLGAPCLSAVNQVDAEIAPMVKEKIVMNEGGIDYRTAFNLVLRERPDLARRRMDALKL